MIHVKEHFFLFLSLCAREVGGHPSGPRAVRLLQDRHHQVVSVRDLRQRKGQCLQLPVATNSSLNLFTNSCAARTPTRLSVLVCASVSAARGSKVCPQFLNVYQINTEED